MARELLTIAHAPSRPRGKPARKPDFSMVNYAPAFMQAPFEASEFLTNDVFSFSHHERNTSRAEMVFDQVKQTVPDLLGIGDSQAHASKRSGKFQLHYPTGKRRGDLDRDRRVMGSGGTAFTAGSGKWRRSGTTGIVSRGLARVESPGRPNRSWAIPANPTITNTVPAPCLSPHHVSHHPAPAGRGPPAPSQYPAPISAVVMLRS
ncbi:hypothetical protein B0H14DRAFT_3450654 [Mycena olivaceomarginata]|nr:hypothetical protein B0H14DRAFT_3450654 [Mycena olivaceomarginata]